MIDFVSINHCVHFICNFNSLLAGARITETGTEFHGMRKRPRWLVLLVSFLPPLFEIT